MLRVPGNGEGGPLLQIPHWKQRYVGYDAGLSLSVHKSTHVTNYGVCGVADPPLKAVGGI